MTTVVNLEQLEAQVRAALDEDKVEELRSLLAEHHPADIADVIDRLADDEQTLVFGLLPSALAATWPTRHAAPAV